MEIVIFVMRALIFAIACVSWFYLGKYTQRKHPRKIDGQIQVDGYELKELILKIDIPDIVKKPYLVIEIKHEDRS